MVIQSNMSSNAIIEVWPETKEVFTEYKIPITKDPIETLVEKALLPVLLQELNFAVGSTTATCTEGG